MKERLRKNHDETGLHIWECINFFSFPRGYTTKKDESLPDGYDK